MRPLTDRQTSVLRVIVGHVIMHGFPPTTREIQRHFGWASAPAARDHLRSIERKGYVVLSPGVARGIRLTERGLAWVRGGDEREAVGL